MDLNLLTALDALLDERSVQGAAERLHVTPPAMSRTLTRIRRATGDEILVRSGRTMEPTPRAQAIRDQVREVVSRGHDLLSPERNLDLSRLRRTFVLLGHDALAAALAPRLIAAATSSAPGVTWRFAPEESTDSPALSRGRVDLNLGSTSPGGADVHRETLGHDRQVLVVRRGHPLLEADALTPQSYAHAHHVMVSRRGRLRDRIDDTLGELGLTRRVVAALPTTTVALLAVVESDAVVAVADRACRPLLASLDVAVRPLPVPTPPVPVVQAWHRRNDGDPAHRWLRSTVRSAWAAIENQHKDHVAP